MFEAVILILQVIMTSVCNISLSFIIKEEIPCLKLTYLMQLMVQTLNQSVIYHIKSLLNTRGRQTHFYKGLNIPLKINVPCMEIMKTCCSEVNLNLETLSNCNFLNEIFFIFYS